MPQAAFDLRIRALPAGVASRCVLLPHVHDGPLKDYPWARSIREPAAMPGTPPREHPAGLWLPPARTVLEFRDSPAAMLGAKIWRLWLDGDSADDLQPHFRTEASNGVEPPAELQARLTCFAGLGKLLDDDEGLQSVASARNAKEFLLYLVEAFRFDSSLEDFARLGDPEMLACLSHLVFEIHTNDEEEQKALLKHDKWQSGKVHIASYPAKLDEAESGYAAVGSDVPLRLPQPPRPLLPAAPPPVIPIQPVQRADGVYFRLTNAKEFYTLRDGEAAAQPDEELKILLHRSEGDIPLENPPVIAASYFGFRGLRIDDAMPGGAVVDAPESGATLDRTFHAIDQLSAGEFVGRQLHYVLEVIDGFGLVRGTSAVTLLRQRFDSPPPAGNAIATLAVSVAAAGAVTLIVEAEYTNAALTGLALPAEDAQDEVTAHWAQALDHEYEVEVFLQERPLDECGFYGDDDDFALMEGLRQADALYDPKAAADTRSPIPGHPMEEHLRGRYDHAGLTQAPLPATLKWLPRRKKEPHAPAGAKPQELACVRLEWSLDLAASGWMHEYRGYHFYAGLRRKRSAEVNIRAPLSPCTHRLQFVAAPAEPVAIDVFQLEIFSFEIAPDAGLRQRFLHHDCFSPVLLRRIDDVDEPEGKGFAPASLPKSLTADDGPVVVELDFTHPAAGHPDFNGTIVNADGTRANAPPLPVGGVRILVRDRTADAEPAPFLTAETIQVLPRTVALYRPIAIEHGLALRPLRTDLDAKSAFAPPNTVETSGLAESEETVRCFGPRGVVDRLRIELRAQVRKIQEAARKASGGTEAGANLEVFRERSFDAAAWNSEKEEPVAGAFDAQQAEIDELIEQLIAAGQLPEPEGSAKQERVRDQIRVKTKELHDAIADRVKPWREKARKALEIDLTEFESQPPPPAPPPPDDWQLSWWPAVGRLVALMRELGLVQDLVRARCS